MEAGAPHEPGPRPRCSPLGGGVGLRTAGLCLLVENYYYMLHMGTIVDVRVGACYSSPTLNPFPPSPEVQSLMPLL